MEDLGTKIRTLRKKQGYSQDELAYQVAVSRQTISKWESNAMRPNAESIQALCRVFNVSADYFLDNKYKNELIESSNNDVAYTISHPKQKFGLYIIAIIIIAFLTVVSIMFTIIVGCTILTTNTGDSVYITNDMDKSVFILLLIVSIILFSTLIALIAFFIHQKRKK